MICPNCRTWLPDHANFCTQCGTPRDKFLRDGSVPPMQPPAAPVQYPSAQPQAAPPAPVAPLALAPPMAAAMGLRPGEEVVQVWRCGMTLPDRAWQDDDRPTPQANGLLVATTHRLAFVEEKGLLGKTYHLRENLPLAHIGDYTISTFMRVKGLDLSVSEGSRPRRVGFGNLYEVDGLTLKALPPAPAEQLQATLDRLVRREGAR